MTSPDQSALAARAKGEGVCPLSPRELDVLLGVAAGLTTDEMAAKFGNSSQTIKNQLTQVMEKLEAPNRTAAVVIALQQGWVGLGEVQVRRRANLVAGIGGAGGVGYASGGHATE